MLFDSLFGSLFCLSARVILARSPYFLNQTFCVSFYPRARVSDPCFAPLHDCSIFCSNIRILLPRAQIFQVGALVRRIDVALADHLQREGVDLVQFAFRWVNCLLQREARRVNESLLMFLIEFFILFFSRACGVHCEGRSVRLIAPRCDALESLACSPASAVGFGARAKLRCAAFRLCSPSTDPTRALNTALGHLSGARSTQSSEIEPSRTLYS